MFKSKPLWWTLLATWILVSTYWHVCRIKGLCDSFPENNLLTSGVGSPVRLAMGTFRLFSFYINLNLVIQYLVMVSVTFALAFFTAKAYKGRKTRELKYKLNQVNRELAFYQPRK